MAGDSATISVNVNGTGWETLTNKANRTTASLGRMQKGVGGLATRFVGLQAVVSMGMQKFRELHQWIGASIEKFREFENRIAEVSTILQGTAMNLLPALQSGVEQLAIRFGKSANDITNGLYDILSAAFAAEDSIRLLNTSIKASIAGLTDVSTSVDVFTSILNAYGKSAAQAAGISDILFQTVVRGKLRFEDLASAMGYITPIAANAGVAFKEIAAALATVTRQGLHVDMASRGLALMLQGVVSPAKAAATAAQQFGIDLSGLALRVKGLKGFIGELNAATQKYGMSILPQIVRNMRSLRVAMALAGEEGILGFAEDLKLMEHATGKTEEALTKMMNTSRRQAEILASSFELVERRIGEAWAGVDIWWKKTQLWWGTLISGDDADAAVRNVENQFETVKRAYWSLLETRERIAEKGSLMEIMLGSPEAIKETLLEFGELEEVKEYFDLGEQITQWAGIGVALDIGIEKLKMWGDELEKNENIGTKGVYGRYKAEEYKLTAKQLEEVNTLLAENGMSAMETGDSYSDLTSKIDDFSSSLSNAEAEIDVLTVLREAAQPSADWFESFFHDITESINNHKLNVLELQNAIKNLDKEIVNTYTSLGGREFAGKLGWELGVKIDEASLSRFEEFTKMALRYGAEYFNEYTNQTDRFGNSLQDVVTTMHNYTEIQDELNTQQQELNKLLDENLLLIRKNNLEKMRLQLIGMIRRRGNTRSEMKMMKQLDIENLKMRIENMGKELKQADTTAAKKLEITETAYDNAKEILDKYLDEERHNLWVLKDIRDDDVRDLEETINFKGELLNKYVGWYTDEINALNLEERVYVDSLRAFADEMPDLYAKIYDESYIDNYIKKQKEYLELLNIGKSVSTTDVGTTAPATTTATATTTAVPEALVSIIDTLSRTTTAEGQWMVDKLRQRVYGTPTLHGGIDRVPYEGLFHLDKGERVISEKENRGGNGNGGIIIENFTVEVAQIADVEDVEKIGALLSSAANSYILDKKGKTRYRLR